MVLYAHLDEGFLNETNSCSHTRAHIFLSEKQAISAVQWCCSLNCPNIKFIMALAAKSELAILFVTAREMIPHRQTLISMGWPQPKSPIQTDNSTAAGVTNKTIVPRQAEMMDMCFWWLRCCASQDQFHYYWALALKTGLTTTPNTTWTPTMKPTEVLMQASGIR
jgi:hypothetical protein